MREVISIHIGQAGEFCALRIHLRNRSREGGKPHPVCRKVAGPNTARAAFKDLEHFMIHLSIAAGNQRKTSSIAICHCHILSTRFETGQAEADIRPVCRYDIQQQR